MAQSNNYSWLLPDPYKNTIHSIGKARVTGEIQYFYKNNLRPVWVHPSALSPSYPIDPSGDKYIYFDGFNSNINPLADGSHLHGAPANFINRYYKKLKDTRNYIESFCGQDWSWINSAASGQLYDISLEEDPTSGGYRSPPHGDFVQYLREVPLNKQNFVGSGTNYSSINPTGQLFGGGGGDVTAASGFFLTQPQTRPNLARESYGSSRWHFQFSATGGGGNYTNSPANVVVNSALNKNGIGTIGVIESPHFNVFGGWTNIDCVSIGGTLTWRGRIYLPLIKLNPSPNGLLTNHGLPLYIENTPGPFTNGNVRNGVVLTPNLFIQFIVVGEFPVPGPNETFTRQWSLEMVVTELNTSYVDKKEGLITGGVGNEYNYLEQSTFESTFNQSLPLGKFNFGDFNKTIKVYPVLDYPSLNGKILQAARLTLYQQDIGFTNIIGGQFFITLYRLKMNGLIIGFD